jgi:hypothetical protein
MVSISPPPEARTRIVSDVRQITAFLGPPPSTAGGTVYGSRTAPPGQEGLQAYLAEYWLADFVLSPHFHPVDQFQVVVAGDGRLGRHPLHRGSVHYADADTPYGPIVAGPNGLGFFTLRVRPSEATYVMPQSRHVLTRPAGRVRYADADTSGAAPLATLDEVQVLELIAEGDGLAATLLRIPPGGTVRGPAASGVLGQYFLVLAGSLSHEAAPLAGFSCLALAAGEGPLTLSADSDGAEVLVLQFGTSRTRPDPQ